jgi:hypothetical protein
MTKNIAILTNTGLQQINSSQKKSLRAQSRSASLQDIVNDYLPGVVISCTKDIKKLVSDQIKNAQGKYLPIKSIHSLDDVHQYDILIIVRQINSENPCIVTALYDVTHSHTTTTQLKAKNLTPVLA